MSSMALAALASAIAVCYLLRPEVRAAARRVVAGTCLLYCGFSAYLCWCEEPRIWLRQEVEGTRFEIHSQYGQVAVYWGAPEVEDEWAWAVPNRNLGLLWYPEYCDDFEVRGLALPFWVPGAALASAAVLARLREVARRRSTAWPMAVNANPHLLRSVRTSAVAAIG